MEALKLFITVGLLVCIVVFVVPALINAIPMILMIVGALAIARMLVRLSTKAEKSKGDPAK